MTDKPMDVERTLRELETKWRAGASLGTKIGGSEAIRAIGEQLAECADELKAVREALREPGVGVKEKEDGKDL